MVAEGAAVAAAKGGLASTGGKVKANNSGQKAVKSGDSYANDKVPAVLSEHEIVLPRSVTMTANAPEAAKRFVEAVLAQKKRRGAK